MVVASSLVGILAAWLLVTFVGIGGGYGLVSAWRRWGERIALPPQIKNRVERVLGDSPTPATPAVTAEEEAESEQDGASSDEATADEAEDEDLLESDSSPPATHAQDPEPEDGHATGPSTGGTETPYELTRADAIEELSLLFDAPYEASKALVRSGLWGMENHEEWARAMRGKKPPEGVPPELYQRVVDTSPKDHHEALEKIREKRTATVQLRSLWGVGPQEAEALYEAGFLTVDAIRETSSEKLAKVPGIGQALAFQMRAAAHGLAPSP